MSGERKEYLSLAELAAHFDVSISTAKKLGIPFTRPPELPLSEVPPFNPRDRAYGNLGLAIRAWKWLGT